MSAAPSREGPGDLVFWHQQRPSPPRSVNALPKQIQRQAPAAGLPASCHRRRQTLASTLLAQGAESVSIRELRGQAAMASRERAATRANPHVKQEAGRTMKQVRQPLTVSADSCTGARENCEPLQKMFCRTG